MQAAKKSSMHNESTSDHHSHQNTDGSNSGDLPGDDLELGQNRDRPVAGNNLQALSYKVDGLERQMEGLNIKVDTLNSKLDTINSKLDGLGTRLDGLGAKIDDLGTKIDGLGLKIDRMGDYLGQKIIGLESEMKKNTGKLESIDEGIKLLIEIMRLKNT